MLKQTGFPIVASADLPDAGKVDVNIVSFIIARRQLHKETIKGITSIA